MCRAGGSVVYTPRGRTLHGGRQGVRVVPGERWHSVSLAFLVLESAARSSPGSPSTRSRTRDTVQHFKANATATTAGPQPTSSGIVSIVCVRAGGGSCGPPPAGAGDALGGGRLAAAGPGGVAPGDGTGGGRGGTDALPGGTVHQAALPPGGYGLITPNFFGKSCIKSNPRS